MALNSMKDIAKLLDFHGLLVDKAGNMETSFTGICNNSKEINQGELFICKGLGFKKEYLEGAIKDGATCYVAEMDYNVDLPYVLTKDIRKAQSLIAAAFYDHPYRAFCLTGITGTKGKTTTTYDLEALLSTYAGRPTGLLSTVERFVGDDHMVSHNTTAESLDLEKLFLRAKENNLPYVTMEVSSQAYKQDRVFGLHFNYGVFLNFGEDHISPNEHENLEDYFACKLQLMTHCDTAIICKSTDRFDNIYRVAKAHARKVMVLGLEDESCDLTAINIKKEHLGFTFDVKEKSTGKVYPYSTIQE
ncbi:MAG TPA: Mur ligase family protein, partial [Anaerovoracaceae bacterium]|nr:Mur ligase family protein [Anaerovoracaceae bacterium]